MQIRKTYSGTIERKLLPDRTDFAGVRGDNRSCRLTFVFGPAYDNYSKSIIFSTKLTSPYGEVQARYTLVNDSFDIPIEITSVDDKTVSYHIVFSRQDPETLQNIVVETSQRSYLRFGDAPAPDLTNNKQDDFYTVISRTAYVDSEFYPNVITDKAEIIFVTYDGTEYILPMEVPFLVNGVIPSVFIDKKQLSPDFFFINDNSELLDLVAQTGAVAHNVVSGDLFLLVTDAPSIAENWITIFTNDLEYFSLTVKGDTEIEGDTSIGGGITVDGPAVLGGGSTLQGDATIEGNAVFNLDSNVQGTSHVVGDISTDANLEVTGTSNLNGDVQINSGVVVDGLSLLKGDVTADSNLEVKGSSSFIGDVTADGVSVQTISAVGAVACGGITSEGDVEVKGKTSLIDDVTFGAKIITPLTIGSVVLTDADGALSTSIISKSELDSLDNIESNIQLQINGLATSTGTSLDEKVAIDQSIVNGDKFVLTDAEGKINTFRKIVDDDIPATLVRTSNFETHSTDEDIHIKSTERTKWDAQIPLAGSSAITGALVPLVDKTNDLGTLNKGWRALYTNKAEVADSITIGGSLTIDGDIILNGSAWEITPQKATTDATLFSLRGGATTALTSKQYSGISVRLADGVLDSSAVFDSIGTFRIGDSIYILEPTVVTPTDDYFILSSGKYYEVVPFSRYTYDTVENVYTQDDAGLHLLAGGEYVDMSSVTSYYSVSGDDMQPVATRRESIDMVDGGIVFWDEENLQLGSKSLIASDLPNHSAELLTSGIIPDERISDTVSRVEDRNNALSLKVNITQTLDDKNKFVKTDVEGKINTFAVIADADIPVTIARAQAINEHIEDDTKHATAEQKTEWSNNIFEVLDALCIPVSSCMDLFKNRVGLSKCPMLDTADVTDFSGMFFQCSKIKSIPSFDVSKGVNFEDMLQGCTLLSSAELIGCRYSFEVDTTALTGEGLNTLYTSLGTAELNQTITLTQAQYDSSDPLIATAKNWDFVIV